MITLTIFSIILFNVIYLSFVLFFALHSHLTEGSHSFAVSFYAPLDLSSTTFYIKSVALSTRPKKAVATIDVESINQIEFICMCSEALRYSTLDLCKASSMIEKNIFCHGGSQREYTISESCRKLI